MKKISFWFENPVSPNVWDDENKRNEYRKWLENKFSITSIQVWLKLKAKDFVSSFQKRHHFSTVAMVRELVPEHKFNTWEFKQVPKGWWNDIENHRTYFTWLKKSLKIKKPEDWYSIKSRQVNLSFLKRFENYQQMLEVMVPDFNFRPWNFSHVPDGWWKKRENQQLYMDSLGKELGFSNSEDWYALKYEDVELSLMTLYGDSPENLVRSFFPEFTFSSWKFNRVPRSWWNDPKNQQKYIDDLGKELGFSKPQDWYKLRQEHLEASFLSLYKSSPSLIAKTFFPDYDFKSWLFITAPRNSWFSYENQKEYMIYLGEKLGFTKHEDWYAIGYSDFNSSFLRRFGGSRQKILKTFFPDYDCLPWKFNNVENGIWKNRQTRLKYFKWLGKILGYKKPEDWYRVKFKDFKDNYGEVLVGLHYDFSPYKFIQDMTPDFDFELRKFDRVPAKYWHDVENRKKAVIKLGIDLGIHDMDEWYNVSAEDFRQNGMAAILKSAYANSPESAVRECFPNHKWDSEKFGNNLKRQRQVFEIAKGIFGENNVIWNYTSSSLRFRKSKRPIELDIFIPLHTLAIEYQGKQHYEPIKFFGGKNKLIAQKNRDSEKRDICLKNGIILIEVPYTWNGDKSEIKKLISNTLGVNLS